MRPARGTPPEFLDEYASAFSRYNVRELADLFVFPVHILSDAEEITATCIPDRSTWLRVLQGLLDAYRALGVAAADAISLAVTEVSPRLASVRVQWKLRREDSSAIYEFTGIYTLAYGRGGWRISAIAHDEVPKLRTAMAAR